MLRAIWEKLSVRSYLAGLLTLRAGAQPLQRIAGDFRQVITLDEQTVGSQLRQPMHCCPQQLGKAQGVVILGQFARCLEQVKQLHVVAKAVFGVALELVGIATRLFGAPKGLAEHQAIQRVVIQCEVQVAHYSAVQAFIQTQGRIIGDACEQLIKQGKALFANGRQKCLFVMEVVIGCLSRDPDFFGQTAQRQGIHALAVEQADTGIEQALPQVAVMIIRCADGHTQTALMNLTVSGCRLYLDAVNIHSGCLLFQGAPMSYKSFNVSLNDQIAHVQFSRPEAMNSMNADFWHELPQCMRDLEASGEARVIVISSTGKHFSAGMDLGVFTNPKALPMGGDQGRMAENLRRTVLQLQASLSSLEEIRVPVLVAIHGGCIGGALDMVCAADSRYCSADAYFTIKETELGMTADVGTLQRLPKLLPQGVVRELAYTGRKFGAAEAKALGFVNEVYDSQEAMLEGVMAIARQIAAHSPLAVSGCKEMLNYSRDHSVEDSLKYMATWQSGMFRPNDMLKTFQAKATKTTAIFDNLLPVKDVFSE